MNPFPHTLTTLLNQRKENNALRVLKTHTPKIDFASNDYLGFSTQGYIQQEIETLEPSIKIGATGSRLISGNSVLFEEMENDIATFHHSESALIYNSGYDANVGLLSSVPQKGDLVLYDELCHASILDGLRLNNATHYKFKHNDTFHLFDLISRYKQEYITIYVVVESVYSMDGDCAPLVEISNICNLSSTYLIVDEAHAIGVFGDNGKGLCNELKIENYCFARIYTYGKAMGCHGASVVGSAELKQFLINYSRSFIYTTALSEHSLLAIKASYQLLDKTNEIQKLKLMINYFNLKSQQIPTLIKSNSAIHCLVIVGNENVQRIETVCAENNLFVKAIKSPTVKINYERLRICLHAYNTKNEIDSLIKLLT